MKTEKNVYANISYAYYQEILDILQRRCNVMELVEPNSPYIKGPYQLPEIKQHLGPFCLGQARVRKWNGTKIGRRTKWKLPTKHIYKCNKESVAFLRKYPFFFDIDDQIDIAFYSPDYEEAVFYTISHEKMCMINKNFWGDFFEKPNCRVY